MKGLQRKLFSHGTGVLKKYNPGDILLRASNDLLKTSSGSMISQSSSVTSGLAMLGSSVIVSFDPSRLCHWPINPLFLRFC